jgi:hypothetical protein
VTPYALGLTASGKYTFHNLPSFSSCPQGRLPLGIKRELLEIFSGHHPPRGHEKVVHADYRDTSAMITPMAAMFAEGFPFDTFSAPRPVGPVRHAVFFYFSSRRHKGVRCYLIVLGLAGDIFVNLQTLARLVCIFARPLFCLFCWEQLLLTACVTLLDPIPEAAALWLRVGMGTYR